MTVGLVMSRGGIILFVCRQPQLAHMVDKAALGTASIYL
jgi:hypothetical protein